MFVAAKLLKKCVIIQKNINLLVHFNLFYILKYDNIYDIVVNKYNYSFLHFCVDSGIYFNLYPC